MSGNIKSRRKKSNSDMTEKQIQEQGFRKQEDLFGRPYYELPDVGFFYQEPNDMCWYFKDETMANVSDGVWAQEVIKDWETFKKMYL